MPNPCPSCNRMASLEMQDPEADNLQLEDGKITGSVRIVRSSACCGDEMKEATFDIDLDVPKCETCGKQEYEDEVTENLSALEEGGSRYQKSYFGAEGDFTVKCVCGQAITIRWSDKVSASDMDDLV